MKECKHCNAQMEDGSNFCPNCGKPWEETPAAEVVAEEASRENAPEIREGTKATPGKIALAVVAMILVVAALIAMIVKGTGEPQETMPGQTEETVQGTESAEDAAEPTDLFATEATIPEDGNPEDVTCKGSYTADDETVIAAADTVVATMGGEELTVSQLQVYYWMEVRNFLNNLYYYGYDATYYGMDYNLGLDYQACSVAEGLTWQQFFLDSALTSWQNYQAMDLAAEEAGYEMEEELRTELDNLETNLQVQAESYGMADAKELLSYNVGNGADVADYAHFLETYYLGGGYMNSEMEKYAPGDAELEAYFDANAEAYAANGLTKELYSVNVRHILVFPEGADSSSIYSETFSEEAWAAGEKQAQEIMDAWLAGEMTEESFAALANEHSADPGSNTNGGLYTDVMQGDMVEEFDAWCFDEGRQIGDTAVVRTDLGFHVMYFSGSQLLWPTYALEDMMVEHQQELLNSALEKYPAEIDYSAIVLGFLDLAA